MTMVGALRGWVRRTRAAAPKPAAHGDVLLVAYGAVGARTTGPGEVSLRTFTRQITWLARTYDVVGMQRLGRGRETWPGRRPRAVVCFDGPHPSVLVHALPRLRARGIPCVLLVRDDAATPWAELKALADTPLVEIHAAVARADWRGVAAGTAIDDVLAASRVVEDRLGRTTDVVAAPPGVLPDPGWLTAFESDARVQPYRAVLWTAPGVNPQGFLVFRTRQWARWPAPTRFGIAERLAWRFPVRLTAYHTGEPRRTVREAPHATLTATPTRQQFRAHLSVLHPFKSHHHAADHLAYLYDDNPFLPPGVPVHYALVHEGRVEAVAAAVGTPVREGGRALPAIGFSTWYRLPVVHHPQGARTLSAAYLAHPCTMLNYDTSVFAWAALKDAGWIRFPGTRFAGSVRRAVRGADRTARRLVGADAPAAVAPALARCWAALAPRVDCAVDRSPAYWEWKFAGNPMATYRFYAWLDGDEPIAACAFGWENDRILLADLVYVPDRVALDVELRRFLGSALRDATDAVPARMLVAETNQRPVEVACRALGLRPVRETMFDWRPHPESRLPASPSAYRSLIDADFAARPAR